MSPTRPADAAAAATIRPFHVTDADAIGELVIRHAIYEQSPLPPGHIGPLLAALIRRDRLWCWLAEAPMNGPIGYVTTTEDVATFTGVPFGHLDCLFVDDDWRSEGIGRELMSTAVDWSARRGHRELQWQSPDWNTDAHRFYARFGATQRTKRRFSLVHHEPDSKKHTS